MSGAPNHDPEHIRSLLEAYVLGELTGDDRREVADALSTSPELRREHDRIERLVGAARAEPAPVRSLDYERRKRAFFESLAAESPAAHTVAGTAESSLTRATLGVVSTATYLRERFSTSSRFRFLVICAAAQAAVILILVFGVLPKKNPGRSAPDRWDHVAVEQPKGLVDEPFEDDVPEAPRPNRRRRIPLAPHVERGVPANATWDGLNGAFARGEVDPRNLDIFRGELRAARSDTNRRLGLVFRRGGSLETEGAVKRGLAWLAGRQRDDGAFEGEGTSWAPPVSRCSPSWGTA